MHLPTLFPTFLFSLALTTSSLAAPLNPTPLEPRQSCYVTCGSTCYSAAKVNAARAAGAKHVGAGSTAGSSNYPHRYNNYEGFDFLVGGTYYEFPLRTAGVYTGGSPGADRVVFTANGQRAGEITHTGASGNNFVKCEGW